MKDFFPLENENANEVGRENSHNFNLPQTLGLKWQSAGWHQKRLKRIAMRLVIGQIITFKDTQTGTREPLTVSDLVGGFAGVPKNLESQSGAIDLQSVTSGG